MIFSKKKKQKVVPIQAMLDFLNKRFVEISENYNEELKKEDNHLTSFYEFFKKGDIKSANAALSKHMAGLEKSQYIEGYLNAFEEIIQVLETQNDKN